MFCFCLIGLRRDHQRGDPGLAVVELQARVPTLNAVRRQRLVSSGDPE
jgi:hypothetical protein